MHVIFIYFILLFSHFGYYFNKRLLACSHALTDVHKTIQIVILKVIPT